MGSEKREWERNTSSQGFLLSQVLYFGLLLYLIASSKNIFVFFKDKIDLWGSAGMKIP